MKARRSVWTPTGWWCAVTPVLLVLATLGITTDVAAAGPASPVTIVATRGSGPGFAGTWAGSGAINDSGTFTRTEAHVSQSVQHSPTVGAIQVVLVFTGADGTLNVSDELLLKPTGLIGTWQLTAGTGIYAGATGHGTSSYDFALQTTTFTGEIALT